MYADAGEAAAGPAEAVSEIDGHGFIVAVEVRETVVVSFSRKKAQGTAQISGQVSESC